MKDTAKVLCRFNDIILARVFAHNDIEELGYLSCHLTQTDKLTNQPTNLTNVFYSIAL